MFSFKRVCGEEKSVDTQSSDMLQWNEKLALLLQSYSPDDIYNADETGIFFRLLPDKTLEFKNVDCHGGKKNKERLTAMVCANMSGTDKLPLLIIGKPSNPRCFKHVKSLPTEYDANKKAWMTSDIFKEWVKKLDKKMRKKQRKIALIIDNCPAHPKIPGLQAVDLVFLPPNTTSKTQPMDQGIIQSLKVQYRKRVLIKYINAIDKGQTPVISILDALHLLSQAWNNVRQSTIANCFRHAGFTVTDSTPEEEEEDDIEDNIPLATLRTHGLSPDVLHTFTTVDEDIETCADLSEDAIVEEIRMKNAPEEITDNTSADDINEPQIQPPSSEEIMAACEVMRHYFECPENSQEILQHLNVITDTVHRDNIMKRSAHHSRITSFFQQK